MSTVNAEGVLTTTQNVGFIKHVFSLDGQSKAQLINVVQYIILGVIPVAILDHLLLENFPSSDFEGKSSVQLLGEVIGQLVISVLAIELVHRVVTGIPTYTGVAIPDLNLFQIAISLLFTTIYAKGVIGTKVRILTRRAQDLWEGKESQDKAPKKASPGMKAAGAMPVHRPSRADNLLGSGGGMAGMGQRVAPPPPQKQQVAMSPPQEAYGATSSALYSGGDANPLVNAATPGGESMQVMEPMAANDFMGGSFGTSF